jgi:hypothetical protein
LPVERANEVLAEVFGELTHVLGSSEAARELDTMLQVQRALQPWREQEPPKAIVAAPSVHPIGKASHFRQVASLASAALLGGILVAGGFYLGGRHPVDQPILPVTRQSSVIVSPEQRQEIARAFALHESVAGPLSWYAADDSTIQVAPVQKGEALRTPIAVVLRLTQNGSCISPSPAKNYVIVLRGNEPASIELPSASATASLRVRLLSVETDGRVNLRYAIAADGSNRGANDNAAVSGQRHVDLGQTSLGQLAMNDCTVNVDAAAWVISEKQVQ